MSAKERPKRTLIVLSVVSVLLFLLVFLVVRYLQAPRMLAWSPPKAPSLKGALAPKKTLQKAVLLAPASLLEPEDVILDDKDRVIASCSDGTIRRLHPDQPKKVEILAKTGGRPLGMALAPDGRLFVSDADRGLLAISADHKKIQVLVERVEGERLRFTNEIALDWPARHIYFTNSSQLVGIHDEHRLDVATAVPSGALFRYDLRTKKTHVMLRGLYFTNGVALSRDRSFLWVAETARYRIRRLWLRGPKKGKVEIFADNLPGFPDNISATKDGGLWVALASRRVNVLDTLLHPNPRLKRLVFALPAWIRPAAVRYGLAVRLDRDGRIVESFHDPEADKLANITSVIEHKGRLYFGHLYHQARGVGMLKR